MLTEEFDGNIVELQFGSFGLQWLGTTEIVCQGPDAFTGMNYKFVPSRRLWLLYLGLGRDWLFDLFLMHQPLCLFSRGDNAFVALDVKESLLCAAARADEGSMDLMNGQAGNSNIAATVSEVSWGALPAPVLFDRVE